MSSTQPSSDKQHLQYSIESSFESAASLAKTISADFAASQSQQPAEVAESMRLCLAEALNNVVEHAYDGREGLPIHVDLLVDDAEYEIRMIDQGRVMPNGCVPEVEIDEEIDFDDIENLPEGGFGLYLLQEELDTIVYDRRDDYNVLIMRKSLT